MSGLFLALDARLERKNEVENFYESSQERGETLNHDDFLAMAHSNASYK